MIKAIKVDHHIGIGDAIQFSSVPENYFHQYGERLVDFTNHWMFDYNPYIVRDVDPHKDFVFTAWPTLRVYPKTRNVFLSNAEQAAGCCRVTKIRLNRPRLYRFEGFPFEKRKKILLHTEGVSHGVMPKHIIDHVKRKYLPTGRLFHLGMEGDPDYGLPAIRTKTLWELAEELSEAQMLIDIDSGPSWIAAAYPDVIVKKVRTKPKAEQFEDWVPLSTTNVHSHWDDRAHMIYNMTENDIGFTWAYTSI